MFGNFYDDKSYHLKVFYNKGWGIKISDFLKGHCAGCSGGRVVR